MKDQKSNFNNCKAVEIEARKNNKDSSKYLIMNHIECVILKNHRISKSCYHGGDLQGNDIQRLIARGLVVFDEIRRYLLRHKPDNVKDDEIEINCNNYARLCSLIDSIFSMLHARRGAITSSRIDMLKSDLNLVRLKWKVCFNCVFFVNT